MNKSVREKLGDLCSVVTKGTTPTSLGMQFEDKGVPFLRIQNLSNSTVTLDDVLFISDETHDALKRSKIKAGDFLITIAGTIGRVAIVPDSFPEANCNQAVAILRFDKKRLSPRFLLHWLNTNDALKQISGKKVTATISNLSLGQIKELELPLPPLEEQKRIASILDKADAIRRKRQQAIQHADDFLRAAFLDMFGDPVTNPKGWEVEPLKQVTSKIGSGSTPRGGKESYLEKGISLIRSLNVHDNRFVHKDLAFISAEQAEKLKNVVVEKDDVLLNITGASVCRATLVDNSIIPARVNQHVCILRADTNRIKPSFLVSLLTSNSFKQYLLRIANSGGATREALTKQEVELLEIIIPPISLQKQYESIVSQTRDFLKKAVTQDHFPLYESLSQKAFAGEL